MKPHASPMSHAMQYLMGARTREKTESLRSDGGLESDPSRPDDIDDVDFSTGSVGPGAAIASWVSEASGASADARRLSGEVRRGKPGYDFSDYCRAVLALGARKGMGGDVFANLGYRSWPTNACTLIRLAYRTAGLAARAKL